MSRRCSCTPFEAAVGHGTFNSIGISSHPNQHDGQYWMLVGPEGVTPQDRYGYPVIVTTCPFCGEPAPEAK